MKIVGGAVQRVDDPLVLVLAPRSALFGQDRMLGMVLVDHVDDGLFRQPVHFADKLVAPLVHNLQRLQPIDVAHHDGAGFAGGANGDIDHCVHRDLRGGTETQAAQA